MGRKARKRKKTKEPFWKKIKNPELKRLAEHIGKITDNTNWKEFLDIITRLSVAYFGYQAGKRIGGNLEHNISLALTSIIAYDLAKSDNLIAGASGMAFLSGIGLINVWNPLSISIEMQFQNLLNILGEGFEDLKQQAWKLTSPFPPIQVPPKGRTPEEQFRFPEPPLWFLRP